MYKTFLNEKSVQTASQIKKYKWKGNHNADSEMFKKIDDYVLQNYKSNPKESAELLRFSAEEGMGIDTSKQSDKQLIKDFLENL